MLTRFRSSGSLHSLFFVPVSCTIITINIRQSQPRQLMNLSIVSNIPTLFKHRTMPTHHLRVYQALTFLPLLSLKPKHQNIRHQHTEPQTHQRLSPHHSHKNVPYPLPILLLLVHRHTLPPSHLRPHDPHKILPPPTRAVRKQLHPDSPPQTILSRQIHLVTIRHFHLLHPIYKRAKD